MAKRKGMTEKGERIPVEEIEVDGVYKSYVNDIVKILSIHKDRKQIVLYNVTSAHKQWIDFKNIYLISRIH